VADREHGAVGPQGDGVQDAPGDRAHAAQGWELERRGEREWAAVAQLPPVVVAPGDDDAVGAYGEAVATPGREAPGRQRPRPGQEQAEGEQRLRNESSIHGASISPGFAGSSQPRARPVAASAAKPL